MTSLSYMPWSELLEARLNPFSVKVLGWDAIVCLECGLYFTTLGTHLNPAHTMTASEYRKKWGYSGRQGLASGRYSEERRQYAVDHPRKPGRFVAVHTHPLRTLREQSLVDRRRTSQESARRRRKPIAELAAQHYLQGMSCQAIGKLLGCSPSIVAARLRERKIPLRKESPYPYVTRQKIVELLTLGMTHKQCAEHFECSVSLVRTVYYTEKPRMSREALLELTAQGRSDKQMAIWFGVPVHAVQTLLYGSANRKDNPHAKHFYRRHDLDTQAIVKMRSQGQTLQQIAEALHCSRSLVQRRLHHAGERPKRLTNFIVIPAGALLQGRRQGMTLKALALKFKCHEETIRARLKEIGAPPQVRPLRVPGLSVETAVARRREGLSLQDIAIEFGCQIETVSRRLKSAIQQGIDIE